jgi:hypothetical protein
MLIGLRRLHDILPHIVMQLCLIGYVRQGNSYSKNLWLDHEKRAIVEHISMLN